MNLALLAIVAAVIIVIGILALITHNGANNVHKSLDSYFNISGVQLYSGNGVENYTVYIASNSSQQQRGYMNQTGIGDCGGAENCLGMLFVFRTQSVWCFWMENTEIPLRQSWIATNGTVTYSAVAVPYSTANVCANGTMVLETSPNASIAVGDRLALLKAP